MMIKQIKYNLLIIAVTILLPSMAASQNSTKRAGIGFRIDENPLLNKVHSYDSLFSLHGQKYSFAVTSYVLPLVNEYVDTLRALSQRGIELLDNTPTHATQFFNVLNYQDTNIFSKKPGVDHINGQKICLKYVSSDTTHAHGEGKINVSGNRVISDNPGEFHDLLPASPFFAVFLNAPVNKLCLFYDVRSVSVSDPDTLYVMTFWGDSISIPDHSNLTYHKLQNNNVVMHDSALKILGRRSLDIFDSVKLSRPVTWIHPDGQYPWIDPLKIKAILGNKLDFKEATSFINPSLFCYDEFNPGRNKQFSIHSEALSMESSSFKYNSHIIAEAVAKGYVLFDFARLANPSGGLNTYIQRMDSLLVWCSKNDIPVRTYSQWKALLYDSIPQKVENIFPRLNIDIDDNGWPDGFTLDTTNIIGKYDKTDGVSISGGNCFKIMGGGTICQVTELAGLEKGSNIFTIYTKCSQNHPSTVQVKVDFPEFNLSQTFDVNSDSTVWMQYSVIVNVPDSVNIADFTIIHDTAYHDTVKISGFAFRSSGFLKKSNYPIQTETANTLFPSMDISSLVIDSIYSPSSVLWSIKGNHFLSFSVDSAGLMKISRPNSFWIGKDSMYAVAHSPDGLKDSCFFRFRSDSVPSACSGGSINISILDTITSTDYIVWTSVPYDMSMSDTTIFNPTVSPKVTTRYRVKVYNLLGNIFHDSILIIRHPFPLPGLFKDSTICKGDSIVLTAAGGTHYLWNTGDTTASIKVGPDTLTRYTVYVRNQWTCYAYDTTTIHVEKIPIVTLSGLLPQYCANDDSCYLMTGTPWYGHFGGSPGVEGSQFCPRHARTGKDTVWYQATSPKGCYNADTVYVTVNPLPAIPKLPDTSLCADKSIVLNAGPGADNYLWSNGETTQTTVIDSLHHGLGMLAVWVYVTKESCVSRDTAMINFIKCPTSVNDQTAGELFTVYPNPFNENIFIVMKDKTGIDDNAKLLNLSGELIYSTYLKDKTTLLPVAKVSAGIYILLLKHNEREYYLKIVKL